VLTWSDLEAAAPELAAAGRLLFERTGSGEGLLATVRADQPPRIHPISFEIVDGRLYAFILKSAKRVDLERDGRYALHAHQDPAAPSEFLVRGRASLIADAAVRARVAGGWPFEVDDSYALFELSIESALLGSRPSADDWPPRYASWTAPPEVAAGTAAGGRDR
jgi:hypothetical protein